MTNFKNLTNTHVADGLLKTCSNVRVNMRILNNTSKINRIKVIINEIHFNKGKLQLVYKVWDNNKIRYCVWYTIGVSFVTAISQKNPANSNNPSAP